MADDRRLPPGSDASRQVVVDRFDRVGLASTASPPGRQSQLPADIRGAQPVHVHLVARLRPFRWHLASLRLAVLSLTRAGGRGRAREPVPTPAPRIGRGLAMRGKLVPALVAATALVFPAAASAQTRRLQRAIAGRQRQQPRPPDVGAGRRAVPPARAGELRGRHQDARQRPADPLRQQPHLQRRRPEPVLGAQRHPVGIRVGPVHGPHVRAAPGGRRRAARTSRSTLRDPLEEFDNDLGADRLHAHAGGAGHRCRADRAPAHQHGQQLHRRLERLRRLRRSARVAPDGAGRRADVQQRRQAPAGRRPDAAAARQPRQRVNRSGDGAPGPADGHARQGDGRR